jgi:hypothetical protein
MSGVVPAGPGPRNRVSSNFPRHVSTMSRDITTVGLTVSWIRTSEWGVSRHRNSVSQVFGMVLAAQAAPRRSVALSSRLSWLGSRSRR